MNSQDYIQSTHHFMSEDQALEELMFKVLRWSANKNLKL